MALRDMYVANPERPGRGLPVYLSPASMQDYFGAIQQAYNQAGLDFGEPSLQECAGFETDEGSFRVSIGKAPDSGEILGAHSLATSADEAYVNETDIFLWDGHIEGAPGRFRTPEEGTLRDYSLADGDIRGMISFIHESINAGRFMLLPERRMLSLPQ